MHLISKSFFGYALFFIIAILSAAVSSTNICTRSLLLKRNEDKVCSCSVASAEFDNELSGLITGSQNEHGSIKFTGKRSLLLKRNEDKVCSCSVASAEFDNELSGLITGSQNEHGSIKFTGKFFGGLPSSERHSIEIIDGCGNLIKDVTDEFNIKDNGDGSSEFFVSVINDLSLDCGDNAIFFRPTSSNCTCAGNNKREEPNPN
ncbi:19833_t:CDS:2 [Entrophospora sp. SA101]|nr:19833_t:CDS:2 [Entrophospora sp. SA101]